MLFAAWRRLAQRRLLAEYCSKLIEMVEEKVTAFACAALRANPLSQRALLRHIACALRRTGPQVMAKLQAKHRPKDWETLLCSKWTAVTIQPAPLLPCAAVPSAAEGVNRARVPCSAVGMRQAAHPRAAARDGPQRVSVRCGASTQSVSPSEPAVAPCKPLSHTGGGGCLAQKSKRIPA